MCKLPPADSEERLPAVLRVARLFLFALAAIDAAWMLVSGIRMRLAWEDLTQIVLVGGSGLLLVALHLSKRHSRLFLTLHAFAMLMAGAYTMVILCYLGATLGLPLIDSFLVRIDALFGFDWLAFAKWLGSHAAVQRAVNFGYLSMIPQILGLAVTFAIQGRMTELHRLVLAFLFSLALSVILASLLPAMGAFYYYGIDPESLGLHPIAGRVHEHDMLALRDGTLRELPVFLKGLITFPSFHTTMALLLIWIARSVKVWLPAGILLNVMMLAGIPANGSHWLADMLGGCVVAALTVVCINRLLPLPAIKNPPQ